MPSTTYRQQKVGKNFETAIAKADITRSELAEILGIHQSSFTYWYKRGVTANYANQVADLLDLDVTKIRSKKLRSKRSKVPPFVKPRSLDEVRADLIDYGLSKSPDEPNVEVQTPEPRTVNIDLLAIVANMRLSVQQETTLLSLALTFLGEES